MAHHLLSYGLKKQEQDSLQTCQCQQKVVEKDQLDYFTQVQRYQEIHLMYLHKHLNLLLMTIHSGNKKFKL